MAYWRLHYHLVWATDQRLPLITEPIEKQIYGVILNKAKELGIIIHAIGNAQDHLHIAASIPPKIAVADCIKHFKGSSARYVNQQNPQGHFGWQEGYGALTFGDRAMSDVVAYVQNQKAHHRQNSIRGPFERMVEKDDGVEVRQDHLSNRSKFVEDWIRVVLCNSVNRVFTSLSRRFLIGGGVDA